MSSSTMTFVAKDYDYLSPLALGDVATDPIAVKFVRATVDALSRTMRDTAVDAGEMSFSRHLIRLSKGDRSFVAIPFFTMRVFRHRSFFVRRDGGLRSLRDLVGKRVGVDDWFATGNTWSRAALREAGVHVDEIAWWVGSTNGTSSPTQDALPPYVQFVSGGQSLRNLLLGGHLAMPLCAVMAAALAIRTLGLRRDSATSTAPLSDSFPTTIKRRLSTISARASIRRTMSSGYASRYLTATRRWP